MATKLYCHGFNGASVDVTATTHLGTNSSTLAGGTIGWRNLKLATATPAQAETGSAQTVTGTTNGIEYGDGTVSNAWLSDPVAADVSISGAITGNAWASESAMAANAAVNFVVDVVRATDNSIVEIVRSARSIELGTSRTVQNFSATPGAAVTVNKGDRLRVRWYIADGGGTMASGNSSIINFGGPTADADGDTWLSFTETITFMSAPSGTTVYLTNTASAVSTASVDLEAWTSRGGGAVSKAVNTAAGWVAPIQWTDGAGGTVIDWFTRPLTAFTLAGMIKANLRALESASATRASMKLEVAVVNGDGTAPSVWGSWCMSPADSLSASYTAELNTTERAEAVYVSGQDTSVAEGKRLRFRVYLDDAAGLALVTGRTATLVYGGSAGATGDSYIVLPQSISESTGGNVSVTGARAQLTGTGRPGTPKVALPGARAVATETARPTSPRISLGGVRAVATATGRAGSFIISSALTGARAAATATARPGTPKLGPSGTRAAASATGRAGTSKIDATGARAAATANTRPGTVQLVTSVAVTGARAAATATGRPGTPSVAVTATRSVAIAAARPGAPSISLVGTRAVATANGRPGTVTVGGNVTINGARAVATATGRAGTVQTGANINIAGARAQATATARPGTFILSQSVSGVRAVATAAGRAGSISAGGNISVSGARAQATATARAGTVQANINLSLNGARAVATATGRPGTFALSVTLTGARAAATATGRPGSLTYTAVVTGARAVATANGRPGNISAGGNISVSGARAAATAASRGGAPRITLPGVRSAATATGRPSGPSIIQPAARAAATATGRPGTLRFTGIVTGTRAQLGATGRAGTPKITLSPNVRAQLAATGRPGSISAGKNIVLAGQRAVLTSSGRGGSLRYTALLFGSRGILTTGVIGGKVGAGAGPALTPYTRVAADPNRTIAPADSSHNRVLVGTGRTRARI